MACIEILPTRAVNVDQAEGSVSYTVEYRATCNNQFDGPSQIGLHFAFPQMGTTHFVYGNSFDLLAKCRRIYGFKRGQSGNGVYYWLFSADYDWSRDTDIDSQSQVVTPFYVDSIRPAFQGEFQEFVKANKITAAIDNPSFPPRTKMPVCNSAQTPVIPPPDIRSAIAGYRVQYREKTWFDYEYYLNKVNKYAVTLVMLDYQNYGGTGGETMFSKTFSEKRLLLANVQTSVEVIYDRRWFNTTLEFLEDDWFHYELDRGLMTRVSAGDSDSRGGTFSNGDFPSGAVKLTPVKGPGGIDIREPVLFDGLGKPLTNPKPENAIYLKFGMYEEVDFTGLGIF